MQTSRSALGVKTSITIGEESPTVCVSVAFVAWVRGRGLIVSAIRVPKQRVYGESQSHSPVAAILRRTAGIFRDALSSSLPLLHLTVWWGTMYYARLFRQVVPLPSFQLEKYIFGLNPVITTSIPHVTKINASS